MAQNKKRKVDRRIERTRQLLRDALMQLIIETSGDEARSYDAITIQDITDKANVARTTFYLHYKDKDELLFESMREIYDGLFAKVNWSAKTPEDFMQQMGDPTDFLHVAQHADFYRVMLSEKGSASFLMRVRRYLAEMMHDHLLVSFVEQYDLTPRVPLRMLSYAMAGALIGTMKWWLDNDMQMPPEEIAAHLESYTLFGLGWALGMPGVTTT